MNAMIESTRSSTPSKQTTRHTFADGDRVRRGFRGGATARAEAPLVSRLAITLLLALPLELAATNTPPILTNGTLLFTGDQSAGILVAQPGVHTVVVSNLISAITPAPNTPAIDFRNTGGANVFLHSGTPQSSVTLITSGNGASGIIAGSEGRPGTPPRDDFLNIPVPGNQEVSAGLVQVQSHSAITTDGTGAHGIHAKSETTGFPPSVLAELDNFNASAIRFEVNAVLNPGGSNVGVGQPVPGILVDTNGTRLPGGGGEFVVNSNGTFSFDPGTNFSHLQAGEFQYVAVDFVLDGYRDNVLKRTNIDGTLFVTVTNTGTGLAILTNRSAFPEYGESSMPTDNHTVFPNLNQYVQELKASASAGGSGNSVQIANSSAIITRGIASHGMVAESLGRSGGPGHNGGGFFSFGFDPPSGGRAGYGGGSVTNIASGTIMTLATPDIDHPEQASFGILAVSVAGNGGRGGNGGTYYNGRRGGTGGTGGRVVVLGDATIHTVGHFSSGIIAISEGGRGGDGGDGGVFTDGEHGGYGGKGGDVIVDGHWNILTEGDKAHGIWAKSLGGTAGTGGSGGWFSGAPAGGGPASDGGTVSASSGGMIETLGSHSFGIHAQSIGGAGGRGGSGGSIFYSAGGDGNSAGSGGAVFITQKETGATVTHGTGAHGLFAQSIGGGGGNGGGAGALVSEGGAGAPGGNGGRVTVTNLGLIITLGTNAHGLYAQSVGGGGGDGGSAVGAGAIGGRGSGTSDGGMVTVTNSGRIATVGTRAHAIFAESVGGGGGDGGSSTGWFSVGGAAGGGGNASNVVVRNSGILTTLGADSSAVFAQSVGGGGGNGGGSVAAGAYVSLAIGGQGGAGGRGDAVLLTSETGSIATTGERSHAIFAQSVGGGGGSGGYAVSASGGDSFSVSIGAGGAGGGGGGAGTVAVNNSSQLTTTSNDSYGVFAQSVGGGGGSGGFSIAGSFSSGPSLSLSLGGKGGNGGDGGAVAVTNNGSVTTSGGRAYGLLAQSVGGGGGNGGFSVAGGISGSVAANLGIGGSGGGGGSAGAVLLENSGNILTGGEDAHGMFAQSVGGGGGSGGFSVSAGISSSAAIGLSFGGSGAAGGNAGNVNATSTAPLIQTAGNRSHGMLAQSIGGGGGDAGFSVAGGISASSAVNFSMGGSGGHGGLGGQVNLDTSSRILTSGDNSHGIFAQSVGGGGGSGGFSVTGGISAQGAAIGASIGGSGGGGSRSDNVTVNSEGDLISTLGDRSHGILAQSIGGSGGDGGFSVAGGLSKSASVNFSMGGSASNGGLGGPVIVTNASSIATAGSNSHGIFAQSVGGGGGSGGFSVAGSITISSNQPSVALSIGGSGGTGGNASNVLVQTTGAMISTKGERAHGVLAQSVGGGGGDGGFSVAGGISRSTAVNFSLGGSGGAGGGGGGASVANSSLITTEADASHAIFAQSVGGGGGAGGFSAAGSLVLGENAKQLSVSLGGDGGGGGDASTVNVVNHEQLWTVGERSFGILAQSVGGGGGDGGDSKIIHKTFSGSGQGQTNGNGTNGADKGWSLNLAIGAGGEGGAAGDGGKVSVTNLGMIRTMGSLSHAIFAQSVGGGGGAGGASMIDGAGGDGSDNTSLNLTLGLGSRGGAGGSADIVAVDSHGSIVTSGDAAHGIMAQSVGGGGGSGGASIINKAPTGSESRRSIDLAAGIGGSGGIAGHGSNVVVRNSGLIETAGRASYGILAQSIGGGGGHGGNSEIKIEEQDNGSSPNGSTTNNPGTNGSSGWSVNLTFGIGGRGGAAGGGGKVEVVNDGTIHTSGAKSHALFAQSVGGGGGAGGMSVSDGVGSGGSTNAAINLGLNLGGRGAQGGDAGEVLVNSRGAIITDAESAHGIMAQSVGGGGGTGGASTTTKAGGGDAAKYGVNLFASIGGSGGAAGDGTTIAVSNDGTIDTHSRGSYGILAQSVGGGGGHGGQAQVSVAEKENNAGSPQPPVANGSTTNGSPTNGSGGWSLDLNIGAGGEGGAAGQGGNVAVTNNGQITTRGDDARAIFAQSVGGGGGAGGVGMVEGLGGGGSTNTAVSLGLSLGGSGGGGGDGRAVAVESRGSLVTLGVNSHAVFAQSVGGGGGDGGASIVTVSTNAAESARALSLHAALGGTGGAGGNGSTVLVLNSGSIETHAAGSYGLLAQSIGAGGGKGSTAQSLGRSSSNVSLSLTLGGSGGVSGHGGSVNVTNAGDVVTRGQNSHAIFAQSVGGGGGDAGTAGGTEARLLKDINVVVGGRGGSSGSGGSVSVHNSGAVTTLGDGSIAVLAQSIGGGGGIGGTANFGLLGKLAIGGGGGAAGDGSGVLIRQDGSVETSGTAAHGVFAQSVGGGGGVAGNVTRGLTNLLNVGLGLAFGQDGGSAGNGGNVTVTTTGDLVTRGPGANGIFAQSIGGGGGLAGDLGTGIGFAGSVGGNGSGAAVKITHQGDILTLRENSHGIFAQSAGSNSSGKIEITLAGNITTPGMGSSAIFAQSVAMSGTQGDIAINIEDGTVTGGFGSAAGVWLLGGANNTLTNRGTVTSRAGIAGTAMIGTDGSDAIENLGVITGSVDLGAGRNVFNNATGGRLNAGTQLDLGSGNVLTNAGFLSPGGAEILPTALHGGLVQTASGTLHFDLGPGYDHDVLGVSGTAMLDGALSVAGFNGYVPKKGDKFVVLTGSQGLHGKFAALQDAYKGHYAISMGIRYTSDQAALETLQDTFGQFAVTGNHLAVAQNLDSVSGYSPALIAQALDLQLQPTPGDPRAAALIEWMNAVPSTLMPAALDLVAPEELGALFDASFAATDLNARHLQRRTQEIRFGHRGFSSGLAIHDPIGILDRPDLRASWSMLPREPHGSSASASTGGDRWGTFVAGSAEFIQIGSSANGAGYDIRTPGTTIGVDYRACPGLTVGLAVGYVNGSIDLINAGQAEMDAIHGTVYATWFDDNAYINAAGGGGYNEYDTRRTAVEGTARGSTHGGEFDGMLGGGYDLVRGRWRFGATLDLQYAYVQTDPFTEDGSLSSLAVLRNDSESFITRVGARVLYRGEGEGVKLWPEVRVGWQHEFLDTSRAITSRFASGAGNTFTVRSPSIGRDSLTVSGGLSAQWTSRLSSYLHYNGQFAGSQRTAHGVSGALSLSF